MYVERDCLEFKSGVIRSLSNPKIKIPFTFDVITNNIESQRPIQISLGEMSYLGLVIHRQIGGWKKPLNYIYKKGH